MLISEVIEQLEELRSEYKYIASNFKTVENKYSYNEEGFLSDGWWDTIHELTTFRDEDGDWYSFLTFVKSESDSKDIIKAQRVLDSHPVILQEFNDNLETYISESLTVAEAATLIEKGFSVIRKVNDICSEHNLGRIGFESDIFLGLDSVHYESSRCW